MPSLEIPGSWVIKSWGDAVVSINKLPLDRVQKIEVSRELNTGSGTCSITVSDPNRAYYDLFQAQDEIEVFMSTKTTPPIGVKVWGGYVDDVAFSIGSGETLELKGKEYMSRLSSQRYSGTFTNADLGAAIRSILSNQTDFTYESVPEVMSYLVSANIANDMIYNAIKQICDQYKVYFWIAPATRDMNVRQAANIVYTPDVITEGDNLLRQTKVTKNSEFMTNDVVIQGAGASTTGTATDASSVANRGTFSRAITVGNVGDATSAGNFAQTVVGNRKDPLDAYELESLFLAYTDPGEYIYISAPTINLDGGYQVLTMKHSWSPSTGIRTAIQINTKIIDTRLYLSDLERRMKMVEKKAYGV